MHGFHWMKNALPSLFVIIEPDKIMTENWNRSQFPGKINPDSFTPYPKNPILAKFFVNIGRADTLGSGVRNLYKYTNIYCGCEPEKYARNARETPLQGMNTCGGSL